MAVTITIEQYLRGKVGYDVPDNAIASILSDRDIEPGTIVNNLSEDKVTNTKLKELCTADLYLYCASTPSTISSHREQDGSWALESGGMQHSAYDSRQLRAMAKAIYDKYGETIQSKSTVKIFDM